MKFTLKQVGSHYNVTLIKLVHKRNGEITEEPGDTLYNLPLDTVKNKLAHLKTVEKFSDENVTLKDYLTEFHKSYIDICKLLKKIL